MAIFVLEDDPARIAWFKEKFGNITVTNDLEVARAKLASVEYDKVFLDFNLANPKGDGIDIAYDMADNGWQKCASVIIHSDDQYGIRHMLRILKTTHIVEAITFNKLKKLG